jgi:hypothetical protein
MEKTGQIEIGMTLHLNFTRLSNVYIYRCRFVSNSTSNNPDRTDANFVSCGYGYLITAEFIHLFHAGDLGQLFFHCVPSTD